MITSQAESANIVPVIHTEDPHQYTLTGLQEMAQAALLDQLTPTTACGLLLASYKYKDLYDEVKSYVVTHWAEIQQNVSLSAGRQIVYRCTHTHPLA
jgi:hypothetical protein